MSDKSPSVFTNPIQGILKYPNHRIIHEEKGIDHYICIDSNIPLNRGYGQEYQIPYSLYHDKDSARLGEYYYEWLIWDDKQGEIKSRERVYLGDIHVSCFNFSE